ETTVNSVFEKYLVSSDAVILVANQNSELWPAYQDGGPLGLQLQLAKQYRIPVHLWLQTKDLSAVRNPEYRSFLAKIEANARGDPDTLIHPKDIDEFVRYISGKFDTEAVRPPDQTEDNSGQRHKAAVAIASDDDSKQKHWTFISFSTQDRKTATEILHELERAGVRCWISYRDVCGGRDYQAAIVSALKQA